MLVITQRMLREITLKIFSTFTMIGYFFFYKCGQFCTNKYVTYLNKDFSWKIVEIKRFGFFLKKSYFPAYGRNRKINTLTPQLNWTFPKATRTSLLVLWLMIMCVSACACTCDDTLMLCVQVSSGPIQYRQLRWWKATEQGGRRYQGERWSDVHRRLQSPCQVRCRNSLGHR